MSINEKGNVYDLLKKNNCILREKDIRSNKSKKKRSLFFKGDLSDSDSTLNIDFKELSPKTENYSISYTENLNSILAPNTETEVIKKTINFTDCQTPINKIFYLKNRYLDDLQEYDYMKYDDLVDVSAKLKYNKIFIKYIDSNDNLINYCYLVNIDNVESYDNCKITLETSDKEIFKISFKKYFFFYKECPKALDDEVSNQASSEASNEVSPSVHDIFIKKEDLSKKEEMDNEDDISMFIKHSEFKRLKNSQSDN